MNQQTVQVLAQVGSLALQAAIEYMRALPRDKGAPSARDAATLALMEQAQRIGEQLRDELDARPEPGEISPTAAETLKVNRLPSAHAHEVEPQGLIQTHLDDNAHDARRAMAATIWGEARSEPLTGRIAVGGVIKNRAARPGWWGRDVLSCCISPGQFSCWWDAQGQNVRLIDDSNAAFKVCLEIAGWVLSGAEPDPTGGADHYHRSDIAPAWSKGNAPACVIGRHVFYRLGPAGLGE